MNSQKDQLNKLGSLRFAAETGQKLTDFYSDDELGEDIDHPLCYQLERKIKYLCQVQKKDMSPDMQDATWNL